MSLGGANQDSKEDNIHLINDSCMRWCYYELNLFGDPSVNVRGFASLDFTHPAGLPEHVQPGQQTAVGVVVSGSGDGVPVAGTGQLHYSIDGGAYTTVDMDETTPGHYEGVLPALECGSTINYYFTAEEVANGIYADPRTAPVETYGAFPVTAFIVSFDDDFNSHLGWSVQNAGGLTDGAWQRAIPTGGGDRGDPASDYDGSGYCYVTDNGADNSDVDDGITYLISPDIDLSAGDAVASYAIWYTNDFGADPDNDLFKVYLSNNSGGSWTLAQTLGPNSSAGWNTYSLAVGDFVAPTANVRIRFEASDLNSGSVVEAGVDAVTFQRVECESSAFPGDLNCDGNIDFDDIDGFVLALSGEEGYLAVYPDCLWMNADCDANDTVDFDDIDAFVAMLGG